MNVKKDIFVFREQMEAHEMKIILFHFFLK